MERSVENVVVVFLGIKLLKILFNIKGLIMKNLNAKEKAVLIIKKNLFTTDLKELKNDIMMDIDDILRIISTNVKDPDMVPRLIYIFLGKLYFEVHQNFINVAIETDLNHTVDNFAQVKQTLLNYIQEQRLFYKGG
jgi:hypothetical protein